MLITADRFSGPGTLFSLEPTHPQGWAALNSYHTLWSSYEVSVTLHLNPGVYQLEIYSKNSRPGPVILNLSANHSSIGAIAFDKDDDSWEVKCLRLYPGSWTKLGTGRTQVAIGIRFANDSADEKGDRNAHIAGLRVVPILAPRSKN